MLKCLSGQLDSSYMDTLVGQGASDITMTYVHFMINTFTSDIVAAPTSAACACSYNHMGIAGLGILLLP